MGNPPLATEQQSNSDKQQYTYSFEDGTVNPAWLALSEAGGPSHLPVPNQPHRLDQTRTRNEQLQQNSSRASENTSRHGQIGDTLFSPGPSVSLTEFDRHSWNIDPASVDLHCHGCGKQFDSVGPLK